MKENMLLKCEIDDDGLVVCPAVHDRKISSIEFSEEELKLTLVESEFDSVKIRCLGVLEVACNAFRKGNIVLDISVYSGADEFTVLLEKLYPKPKVSIEKFDRFLQNIRTRITNNELIIVQLNPSYGGEVIVLCEEICYSRMNRITS